MLLDSPVVRLLKQKPNDSAYLICIKLLRFTLKVFKEQRNFEGINRLVYKIKSIYMWQKNKQYILKKPAQI